MSDDTKLSRRKFLERASMLGAAAIGGGAFLQSCKKKQGDGKQTGGGEAQQAQKGGGGELNCEDPEGLSKSELKRREKNEYVDDSPKEGKNCENCIFYQKPDKEGACGGCQTLPGPVHPKGYCTLWQKKPS